MPEIRSDLHAIRLPKSFVTLKIFLWTQVFGCVTFHALLANFVELLIRALDLHFQDALLISNHRIVELLKSGPDKNVKCV